MLDFSEDEPDVSAEAIRGDVMPRVRGLMEEMREHLRDEGRGELIREGVEVCIVGQVNVGKSSLMNALAGREVSIVSEEAGTTRDVMEVALNVGGYAVRVVDTAGLRDSGDRVEREGVRRARLRAEDAQLKVVVFDAGRKGALDAETRETARLVDRNAVVVFSKVDLLPPQPSSPPSPSPSPSPNLHLQLHNRSGTRHEHLITDLTALRRQLELRFADLWGAFSAPPLAVVPLSCVTREGLSGLTAALAEVLRARLTDPASSSAATPSMPLITRERHRVQVVECVGLLERCGRLMEEDDLVLAAEQLRFGVKCLGRIVGRVDVEEILDVIFADFCIGK